MDADDDVDEAVNDLPRLSVKIQQDDPDEVHEGVQEEPQDEEQKDDELHEEIPDEQMEGVGSQEGEETQEQPGHSEEIERPELPPAHSPEDRYGNFIMSQFPGKEYLKQRVGFQLAQCSSCLRKKRQSKYTTISCGCQHFWNGLVCRVYCYRVSS